MKKQADYRLAFCCNYETKLSDILKVDESVGVYKSLLVYFLQLFPIGQRKPPSALSAFKGIRGRRGKEVFVFLFNFLSYLY